jgi:hypothetical protein
MARETPWSRSCNYLTTATTTRMTLTLLVQWYWIVGCCIGLPWFVVGWAASEVGCSKIKETDPNPDHPNTEKVQEAKK